ncbi:MAG: hypothetical protein KDK30_12160, partial [Leptospiraceae bacterium]|nr:hypothetical protein [Leptospiraceae bacterium]
GILSARVLPTADGFHFEVELDGLMDARGAVSLQDCEAMSRGITQLLDSEIENIQAGTSAWAQVLPEGLTTENYSLEVASAGAERQILVPDELERFRSEPLKLRIRSADGRRVEQILGKYLRTNGADPGRRTDGFQDEDPVFAVYEPKRRGATEKRKGRKGHKKKKQHTDLTDTPVSERMFLMRPGDKGTEVIVRLNGLERANLFLDF